MTAASPAVQHRFALRKRGLIALCLLIVSACGCNRVQEIKPTAEVDRLLNLQSGYDLAYNAVGRPLKDFEELKPYLNGIQDPQAELISPNDGLPYVILYNVERRNFEKGVPVFAYEQQGKGGVRRVVTAMG